MSDKSQMYDNLMFDNVFFSAKSRRDNEVQPSLSIREMAQSYSEQPKTLEPETDEDER